MSIYEIWESQLDTLYQTYEQIVEARKLEYQKSPPATEEELLTAEQKLGVSIPTSLRAFFLHCSKKIEFYAFLPDDFPLPNALRQIFCACFVFSIEELLFAENSRKEWVESCFTQPDHEYDGIWHDKLGLMTVGNGDVIAFDLKAPTVDKPVVYLSHDGSEHHGQILGKSFQDYFTNLLLIGGCGNENWQMEPFFLPKGGLDPNGQNAVDYRAMIKLAW